MLESLKIENYRQFKRYEVPNLNRVNLLVGKNNCGKTSVLEAAQIFQLGADIHAIAEILSRRKELASLSRGFEEKRRDLKPDVTHLFHNRVLSEGSRINIAASEQQVFIELVKPTEINDRWLHRLSSVEDVFDESKLIGLKTGRSDQSEEKSEVAAVASNGAMYIDGGFRPVYLRPPAQNGADESSLATYVSPESLNAGDLTAMWNRVTIRGDEEHVVDSLRIAEPRIVKIDFLARESRYREPGEVFVGFEGIKQKVPLGSLGEGMKRLLYLSLASIDTRHGLLLFDEVDTGLHYSILPDVWRFIVQSSLESDTQVFATTHSQDCLNALARLHIESPDLAEHVTVYTIDPTLEQSISFKAKEIEIAVEREIEVR